MMQQVISNSSFSITNVYEKLIFFLFPKIDLFRLYLFFCNGMTTHTGIKTSDLPVIYNLIHNVKLPNNMISNG